MDVANCLMIRRGYKMMGNPQQRSLPNVHNKDDKWVFSALSIYSSEGIQFQICFHLPPEQRHAPATD